ncbi:MAG: flagellinolysin, partial [Anaerovibrio sp.]|nr:flagellinolysin [Anaerovibrio sp.]
QNSLEMLKESYGIDFTSDSTMVNKMKVVLDNQGQNGTLAYVQSTYQGAKSVALELHVNMDYYDTMDMEDVNGVSTKSNTYLDRVIAHEMSHGIMAANIENFGNMPLFITEGIAELTHGADERVLSMLTTMDAASYTSLFSSGGTTGTQEPYAGGFAFLRYMAAHSGGSGKAAMTRFMDALRESGAGSSVYSGTTGTAEIDRAIAAATRGNFTTLDAITSQFIADINTSTTMENFYKRHCGIDLYNLDVGGVMGWDAEGKEWRTNESTVPEGGSVKYWIYPEDTTTVIDGLEVEWPAFQRKIGGWMFQTGTKSNDGIHVAINDIHAQALGVMDRNGVAIKMDTWSNATAAIRQLDKSLNRALGYQTTIGAIISRMEYTAANLVTASENTQSAESVIRDADMAKEMTAYTKNNVLMQSAQSMLAQANQNSSAVLSLLQ